LLVTCDILSPINSIKELLKNLNIVSPFIFHSIPIPLWEGVWGFPSPLVGEGKGEGKMSSKPCHKSLKYKFYKKIYLNIK